jgi:hypothetical protein
MSTAFESYGDIDGVANIVNPSGNMRRIAYSGDSHVAMYFS